MDQRPFFDVRQSSQNLSTISFFDGEYIEAAMKDTRLTSTEVEASVRKAGFGDLSTVMAVVFEADGELSIVPKSKNYDQLIMKLRNVPD
ncbi:DUF421 domain-containing protein [Pseudoalteromonas sp. Hal099]